MLKNPTAYGVSIAIWFMSFVSVGMSQDAGGVSFQCGNLTGISHYVGSTAVGEGLSFDGQGPVTLVINRGIGPDVYYSVDGVMTPKSSTGAKITVLEAKDQIFVFDVLLNNGDTEKYVLYGSENKFYLVATFHYLKSILLPPRVSLFTASCNY